MNEAAIVTAKEDRSYITQSDINKSFVKVGIGAEKKSRVISDKEKRITAYHEAGHAILFHLLPDVGPVYTVSIIPTGTGAAGYTMPLPERDEMFMTKGKMLQDIIASLGGRIAESLIFETDSGQVYAEALNNCNIQITIDSIKVIQTGLSPETGGTVLDASYVEIGKSPHLVVEYDYRNKDERELWLLANRLRHHCGLPKGPNVNFYKRTAADTIEIKTYKKGIEDFVCSCGEGACAVMAATAVQSMYSVTEKKFRSAGGLQTVEWVSDKDRSSMIFIAEAETVFEGIIK